MIQKKPVLLVDVDGVLTNLNDIPIRSFFAAMESTAQKRGYSEEEFHKLTDKSKYGKKEPGIFNSIYRLVKRDLEKYEEFCSEMFDFVDYSKLKKDENLYKLFEKASKHFDIYIATNNHRIHVKNVVKRLFDKTLDEDELCFEVIDITKTLRDNCFHPKQMYGGLAIYAELAGSEPSNCTLCDDSDLNLDMAKEIGMKGIEITSYYSLSTFLREKLSEK